MPLVRLVIAKARAHGWDRNCIYQFVWKLFSSASTTKATQEDLLQELSNAARSNRRRDIRLTRAMYVVSTSERLQAVPMTTLQLAKGDLAAMGDGKVHVDEFVPRRLKSFNNDGNHSEVLYSAIQKIKSGQSLEDMPMGIGLAAALPIFIHTFVNPSCFLLR